MKMPTRIFLPAIASFFSKRCNVFYFFTTFTQTPIKEAL